MRAMRFRRRRLAVSHHQHHPKFTHILSRNKIRASRVYIIIERPPPAIHTHSINARLRFAFEHLFDRQIIYDSIIHTRQSLKLHRTHCAAAAHHRIAVSLGLSCLPSVCVCLCAKITYNIYCLIYTYIYSNIVEARKFGALWRLRRPEMRDLWRVFKRLSRCGIAHNKQIENPPIFNEHK